jgi:imidazolonepropionase-like amidohydrolase
MYIEKSFITAAAFSKQLNGYLRISAQAQNNRSWVGMVENNLGEKFKFTATYTSAAEDEQGDKKNATQVSYSAVRYPNKAYGWKWDDLKAAENKTYLIKNVTVWTNEKEGILKGYDVITEKGKIKKIGIGLTCTQCETVDGTGKHLTSGIIDEHTHIALTRGGNESGQSSSAEVRMADVLNADDINIYRQLSGGVTTAQVLHGSANAIGGQSALIKLRWGRSEEELLFQGAPGFIKFALGENVKQSNWGDQHTTRYPQTRMGVEQFYFEMFNRAKEYSQKKKTSRIPVRKDLELEILCEILEGKRFITCHSYIQSEINMLMHVADSLGFKVNTFTHILEGYKVADKMKEHGANASTFSDWWAYKFEVNEAIPYNAAILSRVGVNTCVNSDDAEMARRLNHEAAKAMKYGGLTEEEAWKLCTLNPAKMLHIDDRVGSIKEGKDADLVLWSSNPLSIYSHVQFTMIDGMIYYSEERNQQLITYNAQEKNRLVQKMIQAVKDGEDAVPLAKKQFLLYECESLGNQDYITLQIAE